MYNTLHESYVIFPQKLKTIFLIPRFHYMGIFIYFATFPKKYVGPVSGASMLLSLASAEFDLGKIPVWNTIAVKWRGKPIFICHRTSNEISTEEAVPMGHFQDQEADNERYHKPKWLVVLGICTHLGCVLLVNAGNFNGWFWPCHGLYYDTSGRIRKGPALLNLEIPSYNFLKTKIY